ncbi:hypothetical protein [Flavobacterium sp. N1994]|uniref:hypothetical protein n=1 Tax=Flavobacterium sp. N1994 TaxID=2986827 RepID=UPI002223E2AB|nr:hypothetical protein [Flavobacterium sp. N1994]
MKLSKEEIRFIDTYLQSNEVYYSDIRQEMVDHVASAVEQNMEADGQDFYHAFKDYMVIHKRELLKNNKMRWSFSWDTLHQFSLFLVKPYMLLMGVVIFFIFKNVDVTIYFSNDFTLNNLFLALIITLVLFQGVYFQLYLKKRFYVVEKTGTILTVLYYFQLFFLPFFDKSAVSPLTLTIFSFLFLGYIIFFIQTIIKFHQHRFNYI